MRYRMMVGMAAIAALAACGGGNEAQPATGDAAGTAAAETPGAMADELSTVATEYAASLGVDLSAMTKTASGLYYQDLEEGSGEAAKTGDPVLANYTGWLPDGTKFDSSYDRGEPLAFTVGGLIAGWNEGVVGMKVGGKRRLVIPPGLGYGKQPNGPIPAMSTLVFDIDLVAIRK
jgi:FKBP-type peptidyl-prolyl cis-trans isomerase FkpA